METQVSTKVNRWFDESISQLQAKNDPLRQLDSLLAGILHCARKYCDGIFSLLSNHHVMPSAALIRVLFEFQVKLFWCLQAPEKRDLPDQDNCYQRFRQWDYTREKADRTLLTELREHSPVEERAEIDKVIQKLTARITQYESQGVKKSIPKMPIMLGELLRGVRGKGEHRMYAEIYRRFSREVHLDTHLARNVVDVSDRHMRCLPNPLWYNEAELFSYGVAGARDINCAIRVHYGIDCSELQREYEDLVEEIASTKKDST
jgi:hypothetical protein